MSDTNKTAADRLADFEEQFGIRLLQLAEHASDAGVPADSVFACLWAATLNFAALRCRQSPLQLVGVLRGCADRLEADAAGAAGLKQ